MNGQNIKKLIILLLCASLLCGCGEKTSNTKIKTSTRTDDYQSGYQEGALQNVSEEYAAEIRIAAELDSDGDGVTDAWEKEIGSDPYSADETFTTDASGEGLSEHNTVAIEVSAVTDAAGAGTLVINELTNPDIPALSAASLGYMGSAYEISCEGELQSATVTFTYDPENYESPFEADPAIYWYDEENRELVEVPGQVREGGKISANVTHFSKYGLFDRSVMENFWQTTVDFFGHTNDPGFFEDSNNDGLADGYAQTINDGELLFDNTWLLQGVIEMYGDSDDWDGDGLKNGEEISIGLALDGKLKVCFKSNPVLADTDNDGISDYDEIKVLGTSALNYEHRSESALHHLMNDGEYTYSNHKKELREKLALAADGHKYDEAKECLINYFYDYAPEGALEKNAETIAELEEKNEYLNYIGLVSNILSITKTMNSIAETDKKFEDLKEPYYNDLNLKKSLLANINDRYNKVSADLFGFFKLPGKMDKLVQSYKDGNDYDKIDAVTGLIGMGGTLVKTYYDRLNFHKYSLIGDYAVYETNAVKLGKSKKLSKGTALTIACDVVEGVEDIAELQLTYGKIKANFDAYSRYLDLLLYVGTYAEQDYVRDAAYDLALIIWDNSFKEYEKQLAEATASSAAWTLADIALDVASKHNPYVAIAKTFIDLYGQIGINELTKYNVYFDVMNAISDGCKAKLNALVTMYDQTFSYPGTLAESVENYMTQLAQSRIIGEYYFAEYCADESVAGFIASLINHVTPQEYRDNFKTRVKTTYDYANRLQLLLSPNLPYFDDYWDNSVAEDALDIPIDEEKVLHDAAGTYVLASGARAWETRLYLREDGSFEGRYYDMNMGESGVTDSGEAYDGTMYQRYFSGRFELGKKDGTKIELIKAEYSYEGEDMEENIFNYWGATRVVNSAAAGIEYMDGFTLYNPYTSLSEFNYNPWELFGTEQDYVIGVEYDGEIRSYFARVALDRYDSFSDAYADYILSAQYESSMRTVNRDNVKTALYDMDNDGIPELFITNGYEGEEMQVFVYSFYLGQVVQYAVISGNVYSVDDPQYPGVFEKTSEGWVYRQKDRDIVWAGEPETYELQFSALF